MTDFSTIKSINLPIETMVSLVMYFTLGVYAIFSAILFYHWKNYGTDGKVTGLTLILYFSTTIPLLIVMSIMTLII